MAINFAAQLSPRRGPKTLMATTKKDIVLGVGEIFFEYPDTGLGTGGCKVKVGDGVTTYENLEYAIENDASGAQIYFDPDSSETVAAALAKVVSGASNATIVAALKQAVTILNGEVVKAITIDGVAGVLTNNAMTFTTPDYTVGATSSASGATVTLTPASGYGKSSSSFGIKSTDGTIAIGVTSGALDLEIGTIAGAASTIMDDNLTASMALVSDANGKVAASSTTTTEIGYLSGVSASVQTQLNNKSEVGHTHTEDDITGYIDVAKLYGGASSAGHKIDIALLPAGALERLVVVADAAARLALTSADVQVGDVVKQTDTGVMYFVKDESALGTEAAFEVFTAGAATEVPWSGVTGKPSVFPPEAHVHTMSDITDLYGNFGGATSAANGSTGFVPAPQAGDEEKYLCGNGSWVAFTNATSAAAGLMSAEDFNAVALVKAGVYDFGYESAS